QRARRSSTLRSGAQLAAMKIVAATTAINTTAALTTSADRMIVRMVTGGSLRNRPGNGPWPRPMLQHRTRPSPPQAPHPKLATNSGRERDLHRSAPSAITRQSHHHHGADPHGRANPHGAAMQLDQ